MSLGRVVKDPDSRLDFVVDWSSWLPSDDFIASAAASVQSGLTLHTQTYTSTQHAIWVSGGVVGTEYNVTSRIETNGGRIDERTFKIRVLER